MTHRIKALKLRRCRNSDSRHGFMLVLCLLAATHCTKEEDKQSGGTDRLTLDQRTMLERRGAPDLFMMALADPAIPGETEKEWVESWSYFPGGTQLLFHNGHFIREEPIPVGDLRRDLPPTDPSLFSPGLTERQSRERWGAPNWEGDTQWAGRPARLLAWHGNNASQRPILLAYIDGRLVGVISGLLMSLDANTIRNQTDDDDDFLDDDDITVPDDDDFDNCCQPGDPCGYANDGLCDCRGLLEWNYADCSGGDECCATDDPCNLAYDGYCDCGHYQAWDANDCGVNVPNRKGGRP